MILYFSTSVNNAQARGAVQYAGLGLFGPGFAVTQLRSRSAQDGEAKTAGTPFPAAAQRHPARPRVASPQTLTFARIPNVGACRVV